MNRRGVREGLVGLLILVGLGIFVGLFLWLSGGLNQGGYRFSVSFRDANGLSVGAPVRLRGVRIGQVETVVPKTTNVQTRVLIDREGVIIPKSSDFTISTSGLIGETFIEIFPSQTANPPEIETAQLIERCQQPGNASVSQVICPDAKVSGRSLPRFQELVLTVDRLAQSLDEQFFRDFQTTARKFGSTADDLGVLARKVSKTTDVLTVTVQKAGDDIDSLGKVARSLDKTVTDLDVVLVENRRAINTTLANLEVASGDFQAVSTQLRASLREQDLTQLIKNANEAVFNVRQLTTVLADPGTVDSLRETIDSARTTLNNVQKVTADVEELTGDAKFRQNLRRLIDGLGNLVSDGSGNSAVQPAVFTPAQPPLVPATDN
ncbi:MAG: MCE family protein [Gemmatimonadaceae bacterium]|nr:MCE family protein [Gloeobacterales cyanobacterium ES-bin-141]